MLELELHLTFYKKSISGEPLSSPATSRWAMQLSSAPPYYLIMTGGCLTIVTSIVILLSEALNTYYSRFLPVFNNLNQPTSFALTLLPGLAIIYLGQRFLRKPQTQLQTASPSRRSRSSA